MRQGTAYGGALRRFTSIKPKGHRVHLNDDHPALVKGQSLFQARVEDHSERPRLLIDGHNSRKIGKRVTKGKLKGFPIFTLTLEERATCPRSCLEWRTYPALHIFGYTARQPKSKIGQRICEMLAVWPERFHVRFSGWNGPRNGSVVIDTADQTRHLICPAQLGKTDCCATCALCWHSDRTIAFLRH